MRTLTHKDLCAIPGKIAKYTIVLEPVDDDLKEFSLHIRAIGLGGGTLHGARGELRTWKNVNKALRYIRSIFGENEVVISLNARDAKEGRDVGKESSDAKERSDGKRGARLAAAPDSKKRTP